MKRRQLLKKISLGSAALSVPAALVQAQEKSIAERQADILRPNPALLKSEWELFTGGKKAVESADFVLDMATLADNPSAVPVRVHFKGGINEQRWCQEVILLAEKNPLPLACRLRFTPLAGVADAAVRIRLSQSQKVYALAKMSTGEIFQAHQDVTVAASGCGM